MQAPGRQAQPLGIVYNTTMSRPDAALALAMMYGFEAKREVKIGSVCVSAAGFESAVFCDLLGRFYHPGPQREANQVLPTGFAAPEGASNVSRPADSPMVRAAVERKNDKGEPQYARSVVKVSDTALPEAVIRNGVIYNAESVMILSTPATYLAKSLDLLDVIGLYQKRVKMLVIVDSGSGETGPSGDPAALRKVLATWPGPMVFCAKEVGDSLQFPGASIEKDFTWAPAHPVVDAYRAFMSMPYDSPAWDLAAAHYAVHPDSGFFKLSDPGAVSVQSDGSMKFTPGGRGKVRSLLPDPAQHDKILQTFVDLASAKPAQPGGRGAKA